MSRSWCWSLIALSLTLADAARAGPFEDALAAYKRKDYASAFSLFRSLAEAGDPRAQDNLGVMYGKGNGVPQDYAESFKWHRRAAEQGFAHAQGNLGVMYAKGDGVPQDYVRAHMWLSLSASKGEQIAVKNLEIVERQMTPAQITEAQRLARDWKPTTRPPTR